MKLNIPKNVNYIINELEKNGFEAYMVGGCVRDQILGRNVDDYDITTNAKPDEIKNIFKKTIDTGIKHGTVTVLINDEDKLFKYEVTTFRIDGEYLDNRHPSSIEFVDSLYEDLSRRDFTINAMAYNDKSGLIDKFDGIDDLNKKVVRAVGEANNRFTEDALRMIRAIRFAAKLGFEIDKETYNSIVILAENIKNVSKERIQVELIKILISDYPEIVVLIKKTGLSKYICDNFDLIDFNNIIKTKDFRIAICSLLYDLDDYFDNILNDLRFDNETKDECSLIIKYKNYFEDNIIKNNFSEYHIKKLLFKIGYKYLFDLVTIYSHKNNIDLNSLIQIVNNLKNNNEPIFIKDLDINGNDLISLGFKEKQIGECLINLLDEVHRDKQYNIKNRLINLAKEKYYGLHE